jgi:DNA-binding SARP family transcriptional activator/DNA-binding beta-propeller fold protein YncE
MEYRVLGPLEILAGGKRVPLGPPKQRVVIGALLLHPHEVVSSERLVDELWGERPPPSAGKLLQGYVSALRKALDAAGASGVIATRPPGYIAAVADDELDSRRFERDIEEARSLAEADRFSAAAAVYGRGLARWRGAALADVPFESFARSESERLDELRVVALAERFDCALALGQHGRLVAELEALVAEYPLRERFRAQLMLALYRSGRQGDALAVYQDARRRLVEELGIEPSPELRELEQGILRQEATLQPPAAVKLRAGQRRLQAPRGRRLGWAALALAAAGVAAAAVVFERQTPSSPLLSSGTVGMIDPQTNRIGRKVETGIRAPLLADSGDALWAAGPEGTVARIDTRSKRIIGTVAVGSPASALVADSTTAWLGTDAQRLVAIDAPTLAVRRRIRLPAASLRASILGATAPAIALGGGFIWVSSGENAVRKIDARTGRVLAVIRPPRGSNAAIAYGEHAVWLGGPDAISRISPGLGRVTSTFRVEGTPVALAVSDGSLWIALGTAGKLLRVDTTTEAPAAVIPLPNAPTAVVAVRSGVWVASEAGGAVYRIDPRQNKIVAVIRIGAAPTSLAAAPQGVWVGVT